MSHTIAIESPLSDDVAALVAELNAWALLQTPREFTHHMSVEQMAAADTTVFIARDASGAALSIGALKRHSEGFGEVKRMYTRIEAHGAGLAGRILTEIEGLARREGLSRLALETGAVEAFAAAWHVYARQGFTRCGAFLDYPIDSQHNVYYEKFL